VELSYCLSLIIMSNIKRHLLEEERAEQELWLQFMELAEENKELFQQLVTTPEEVIGYEE
jgi:hypothetical protein